MKSSAEAAFASVMAILISGCAATQAYDGPPKSREQIAVITGMSGWEITNMGIAARVTRIDGKELAEASSKIEVLPGKHEIEVECWMQRVPKSTNVNSIDAEAGVDYLIFIGAKDGKCFTRILNKRR